MDRIEGNMAMALNGAALREAAARRRAIIREPRGPASGPRRAPSPPDQRLLAYLEDPFLHRLWEDIRQVGHIRSISLDLTHLCQLRCQGCYFFLENMDRAASPNEEAFDRFLEAEVARGTNMVTVIGGEPSLALGRLKKLHDRFVVAVATNGLRRIPFEGFETLPIGVSLWGDHETDRFLRGRNRTDVFTRALRNYRDDPRVMWYYTVAAGRANEVESVVTQCIENGNYVYFNYYEDNDGIGGDFDHRSGFEAVRRQVDRMIDRYPDRILTTSYLNRVITTNQLFDMTWGYDTCPVVSTNYPKNFARLANGVPFNPHYRAYNPDLTVRRCSAGEDRECNKCYNAYCRHTWVMLHRNRHYASLQDFTHWITSTYCWHLVIRAVDFDEGVKLLPEIHARGRAARLDRA
jgi:MoaA/NifB/PqqE/SkfB family radical SAM enzyme